MRDSSSAAFCRAASHSASSACATLSWAAAWEVSCVCRQAGAVSASAAGCKKDLSSSGELCEASVCATRRQPPSAGLPAIQPLQLAQPCPGTAAWEVSCVCRQAGAVSASAADCISSAQRSCWWASTPIVGCLLQGCQPKCLSACVTLSWAAAWEVSCVCRHVRGFSAAREAAAVVASLAPKVGGRAKTPLPQLQSGCLAHLRHCEVGQCATGGTQWLQQHAVCPVQSWSCIHS